MRLPKEREKQVFVPDDEDNGFVIIKGLTDEAEVQIEGKYMEASEDGIKLVNYPERIADLARACLKDWGGLKDENGGDLKFTAKNVQLASAFVIYSEDDSKKRFFEWVNDEREKFQQEIEEEEKLARKN